MIFRSRSSVLALVALSASFTIAGCGSSDDSSTDNGLATGAGTGGSAGAGGSSQGTGGTGGSGVSGKGGASGSGGSSGTHAGGSSGTGGSAGQSAGGSKGGSAGTGGANGGTSNGGTSNGGTSNGGSAGTGGNANGGTANGGSAGTGGNANGGTANGGTDAGGTANGGSANGGTDTGGTANGGTANGGTANGGNAGSGQATCDPVSSAIFLVDPVNGDDAKATGSGTAGGVASSSCAFKTVTAALAKLGAPSTATTLEIVGVSTVAAGETFPLEIPANTTVTASGGTVTVSPPAGQSAFQIKSTTAGIDGANHLVIQGTAAVNAALETGIDLATGSGKATFVRNVIVQGFAGPGIHAHGTGGLTVGPGVTVQDNGYGTGTAAPPGIVVGDTATLAVDLPLGTEAPVLVTNNHSGGLGTSKGAVVTITGKPGTSAGNGTVVFSHNKVGPGVEIATTGGLLGSSLDGIVSYKNGGSGVRTYPDAILKIRRSELLGNGLYGIRVEVDANTPAGSLGAGLDFGTALDYGHNVLGDPVAANGGAGICLFVDAGVVGAGITILAQGNDFGSGKDCATVAASLSKNTDCSPNSVVDVGVMGTGNKIDFKMCK